MTLSTPALCLDQLSIYRLGTYRRDRNGFGCRDEISLNSGYLDRPSADLLGTLFHEMLHQWESAQGLKSGSRSYHTVGFRKKVLSYGLVVGERGHSIGIRPGPFLELLAAHNGDTHLLRPPEEHLAVARPQGDSTMKKWSCHCTNVRCAVNLEGRCLKCGREFRRAYGCASLAPPDAPSTGHLLVAIGLHSSLWLAVGLLSPKLFLGELMDTQSDPQYRAATQGITRRSLLIERNLCLETLPA